MTKRPPRIYTKTGDDGTTGLLFGERVRKDSPSIELVGTVDEAQASLGVARALAERDGELDDLLISIERDLWLLMAEVVTPPSAEGRTLPGAGSVDAAMIERLEREIDRRNDNLDLASSFSVPGSGPLAAQLDLARTVVRRAERLAVGAGLEESLVVVYLNRLSDLCWALARSVEEEHLVQDRRRDRNQEAEKGRTA